jgi:hypothetical protein
VQHSSDLDESIPLCHVRAINGTGIFLHTGLGRAPFSTKMTADLVDALRGYTIVEVNRSTGDRDLRERAVVDRLTRLANAEAGTIVNNNAAAVLLVAFGGCLGARRTWEKVSPFYLAKWQYTDIVYSGMDSERLWEGIHEFQVRL